MADQQQNQQQNNQKNNGNKKKQQSGKFIIIIVLLAIATVTFVLLYMSEKEKADMFLQEKKQQKEMLESELDSLMAQHNEVKQEYSALADSLSKKDSIIQENAKEIDRLLDVQWNYVKVQRKLERLREIAQGYLKDIDSLYRVNDQLKEENIAIKNQLQEERLKARELTEEKQVLNERVDKAAVLRAYDIEAMGVRSRWFGDKETVEDKARRVEKIKLCFTIGENSLVSPGQKDIFIRIARPDNLILTNVNTDEYAFEFKGDTLQYTLKKTINYQQTAEDHCLYWENLKDDDYLLEGQYVVTLFSRREEIGQTSFTFR
ncbi:MAG: hypothetical protein K9I94_03255 [Bacteroidales bacterium]|nr:hypothetical protein [Bacteroidales bacterium]